MRGKMELELRKIGNSFAVILPAAVMKALQVKKGSKLTLLPNENGYQLSAVDAEFEEQVRVARSQMKRYSRTLRELAK